MRRWCWFCVVLTMVVKVGPLDAAPPNQTSTVIAPTLWIEAAYPSWRVAAYPPELLPLDRLDRVHHTFIAPGADGSLVVPDDFLLPEMVKRVHTAGKTVYVGVGGKNHSVEFAQLASDPHTRERFVNGLTVFLLIHGYDGVLIDWQFPQSDEESDSLKTLVVELRQAFTAAGHPLGIELVIPNGELFGRWIKAAELEPVVDNFLLVGFGYYDGSSPRSGHIAPIYPPAILPDDPNCIHRSITYWLDTQGIEPGRLMLGLTTYGSFFNSESLYLPFTEYGKAYYAQIQPLVGQGYTPGWDPASRATYLTEDDGSLVWSYEDTLSAGNKALYAQEQSLAGLAIWDITGDLVAGEQPLLNTVYAARSRNPHYLPVIANP